MPDANAGARCCNKSLNFDRSAAPNYDISRCAAHCSVRSSLLLTLAAARGSRMRVGVVQRLAGMRILKITAVNHLAAQQYERSLSHFSISPQRMNSVGKQARASRHGDWWLSAIFRDSLIRCRPPAMRLLFAPVKLKFKATRCLPIITSTVASATEFCPVSSALSPVFVCPDWPRSTLNRRKHSAGVYTARWLFLHGHVRVHFMTPPLLLQRGPVT